MGRKEQDERKGRRGEKRFQREGDEKVSEQTIHTHITYERKRNRKIMRKGHCQKVGKKTGRFSLRKKRSENNRGVFIWESTREERDFSRLPRLHNSRFFFSTVNGAVEIYPVTMFNA